MSQTIGFALTGKIGAGKSTTCKIIASLFGPGECFIASFAAPLKKLAVRILDRPIDKSTDRPLLVAIGMGMRSDQLRREGIHALIGYMAQNHPETLATGQLSVESHTRLVNEVLAYCDKHIWGYKDHWADMMRETVNEAVSSGALCVVIEDMRFINEASVARAMGFIGIRVECEEEVRLARLLARDGSYDPKVEEDASEKEWPLIQYDRLIRTEDESGALEAIRQVVEEARADATVEIRTREG